MHRDVLTLSDLSAAPEWPSVVHGASRYFALGSPRQHVARLAASPLPVTVESRSRSQMHNAAAVRLPPDDACPGARATELGVGSGCQGACQVNFQEGTAATSIILRGEVRVNGAVCATVPSVLSNNMLICHVPMGATQGQSPAPGPGSRAPNFEVWSEVPASGLEHRHGVSSSY